MRASLAVLSVIVLAGCAAVPVLGQMEGGSLMLSDKTFTDHVYSFATDKNCSQVRREKGLEYCEEDELVPMQNIYCYRTLGDVTCYDRIDPHQGRYHRLGVNDHNYVRRH